MNDIVSILGVQNVTECALVSAVTLCLNVVLAAIFFFDDAFSFTLCDIRLLRAVAQTFFFPPIKLSDRHSICTKRRTEDRASDCEAIGK